ncbi:hypothetical protein BDN67DRAFT_1072723 [Paxillus ammoniavirescens]|nr:hypothetical protein BDN67DRAFT_1072723 [Paxillus ammoniavirescens]
MTNKSTKPSKKRKVDSEDHNSHGKKKRKSKDGRHRLQVESSDESDRDDDKLAKPSSFHQSRKSGGHKKVDDNSEDHDLHGKKKGNDESDRDDDKLAKSRKSERHKIVDEDPIGLFPPTVTDVKQACSHSTATNPGTDNAQIAKADNLKPISLSLPKTQPEDVDIPVDGVEVIPRSADSSDSEYYASNSTDLKRFPNGHKYPGLSCKDKIPTNTPPVLRAALAGYEKLYREKGRDLALCMGMEICILVIREQKKLGVIAHAAKHARLIAEDRNTTVANGYFQMTSSSDVGTLLNPENNKDPKLDEIYRKNTTMFSMMRQMSCQGEDNTIEDAANALLQLKEGPAAGLSGRQPASGVVPRPQPRLVQRPDTSRLSANASDLNPSERTGMNGVVALKDTTRMNIDKHSEDNGVDDQVGDMHKKTSKKRKKPEAERGAEMKKKITQDQAKDHKTRSKTRRKDED